jgi:penicillin-binding protein 2
MGAAYLVVVIALVSTQVVRQEHFAKKARDNRQMALRVLAPRGEILDRQGIPLADNVHQARLTVARRRAHEGDPSLERLLDLLDLNRVSILRRIETSREPDRVTVLRHADPEQIAVVEEHRAVLPDVQLELQPRRRYRFGSLAAHILGTVGEVGEEDLAAEARRGSGADLPFYQPGDMIGRGGVEGLAETQLRGVHGRRLVEVNAAGHNIGEIPEGFRAAERGVRIYLTISQPLQAALEELLEGKEGAGVVLEVQNGDVLAAASSPSFDPNEFTGGISARRWRELNEDPATPLFNRVLQGTYPPGSPYKIITAVAGLESGKVRPSTRFSPCTGGWRLGNRVFRCWKPSGHGSLDLEGAIAQSCDVYFYQLAERLTLEELERAARRFGLGQPTGVEIPGEAAGLVPSRAYYDRRFGPRGWTRGVLLNNAIGQGELLVTPLQMARAYAAVGGDGHLYQPHLILARENAHEVVDFRQVLRSREPVCDPEIRRFLRRALVAVVSAERGTGALARVEGVEVAGKTGTAENPAGEDHAWFVAYAPANDPEIAVSVIVEHAGHGGDVAAPIVGELMETYFRWKRETAQAVQP